MNSKTRGRLVSRRETILVQNVAPIPALGLLITDRSFNLIASNLEAAKILAFPAQPESILNLDAWLAEQIRTGLVDRTSSRPVLKPQFQSQRRTYSCRSFPLNVNGKADVDDHPSQIVLIERHSQAVTSLREVSERFGLTKREQETVKYLLEGLTSKEIAQHMHISPNTVKAFIRLVMVKMRVSTRSGILGKIIGWEL